MNRRDLLKIAGAGAAGAVAGCIGSESTDLEIDIWQTDVLSSYADVQRGDPYHPGKVAKSWVESVYEPAITTTELDRVDCSVREEKIDVDFDSASIIARSIEWDEKMENDPSRANHANVLLDVGGQGRRDGIVGLALNLENFYSCDMDSEHTDTSVVQYADMLLELEPEKMPSEIPIIQNGQPMDDFMPEFVASAVAHEIGHNLCGVHPGGNAWRSHDVPQRMHPTPSPNTMYASNMMAFYLLRLGGGKNICGEDLPELDYEDVNGSLAFYEDFSILPKLSECVIARIATRVGEE